MKRTIKTPYSSNASIKRPDIRGSINPELFDELIKQLDKKQQELSRNEIISQIYGTQSQTKNLSELLEKIINVLLIPNTNNIRIIIDQGDFGSSEKEKKVVCKAGEHADDFSYLDGQIADQLLSKSPFIITDTLKTRSIKFLSDVYYPKAIIAYKIVNDQVCEGFYWFGFNDVIEITKDELDFFNDLNEAISIVVNNELILDELNNTNKAIEELLHNYDEPFFLIKDNQIVFSNSTGNVLIKETESKINIIDELLGIAISDHPLETETQIKEFSIDNTQYKYFYSCIYENNSKYTAILLHDISIEDRRRKLHAIAFETLAQIIRAPIIENAGMVKMIQLLGEINQNQKTYLQNINKNLDLCLDLADDLTDINRMNSNNGIIIDEFVPNNVTNQVVEVLKPKIFQKRLKIEEKTTETQYSLLSDQKLFSRSVYLVMEYAINQCKVDSVISIEIKKKHRSLDFIILDSTTNLSKFDFERIISGDVQSDIEKNLYLANRILNFINGVLSISYSLEKGCQFHILVSETNQ